MDQSYLSDELFRELSGCGGNNMLCTSSKRKRKADQVGQESEPAPPLSKSALKKQEQLQMKQIKESKRSEYFKTISTHSISEDHRKLLVCTKDMGQADSNRKKLKRSLSKHRAGIILDTVEMDMLFSQKNNKDDDSPATNVAVPELPGDATVYSHLARPEEAVKKTASLLQQFEDIKARGSKAALSESPSHGAPSEILCLGSHNHTNRTPYIASETVIPINGRGKIEAYSSSIKISRDILHSKRSAPLLLNRDPLLQESRLKLPICGMEQEIVEAISSNDVIILCGETGSGKSTQVPQFLFENGFSSSGLIGITQPRRVAVTSTASRVAMEMGCPLRFGGGTSAPHAPNSQLVGFQIRHDSSTLNADMKIKFMTDGILLKEISGDILLRKYTVVILDEAHERNVNTDVLLGMLSRAIPLRRRQHEVELREWLKLPQSERVAYESPVEPLRLVIMSATLRVEDFLTPRLFGNTPPVIKVEARQFSVKTHFSKRTETNEYLEEAFQKVCQIHKKLPPGGILLFLTGKREIMHMCRKLTKELNTECFGADLSGEDQDEEEEGLFGADEKEALADQLFQDTDNTSFGSNVEYDRVKARSSGEPLPHRQGDDLVVIVDRSEPAPSSVQISEVEREVAQRDDDVMRSSLLSEAVGVKQHKEDCNAPAICGKGKLNAAHQQVSGKAEAAGPSAAVVLPLYAMLAPDRQNLVFQDPPEGHRLIVVATNVAETSITIPGVRYVVDCGRQKERIIDVQSGISKYKVTWISKASADQRTGRAGRTGPGHCYRLYSSSFFHQHMIDFQEPEICSFPLEDLVLQLRSIGIRNVDKFPFPTPPPITTLLRAETLLTNLGALHVKHSSASEGLSALASINSILDAEKCGAQLAGGGITILGKNMAKFPINARLAKMLIVSYKAGNVPMGLCISVVVCLTERTIFSTTNSSRNFNESDDDDDDDNDCDEEEAPAKDTAEPNLWMHPSSDVLARVRAFGAYFFFVSNFKSSRQSKCESNEKAALAFCEARGLHHATLSRCVHLFKQLCHISRVFLCKESDDIQPDFEYLPPPSPLQETALRQVMLTGYGDSIARRVPTGSSIFSAECSKRKKLTAYLSCDPAIASPLFIHPHSTLFRKDPMAPLPEFVIYTELLMSEDGDTTYMSGVTQISPGWISELTRDCPLLHWSPPLTFPTPFYDKDDVVKCFVSSTYGIHKWELPVQEHGMLSACRRMLTLKGSVADAKRISEELIVYRWFGRFLLEGKVLSHNKDLKNIFSKENLVEAPQNVTDVKSNRKVEEFVRCLAQHEVSSLATLRGQLHKNSNYLVDQIQLFFKDKMRKKFVSVWLENCASI